MKFLATLALFLSSLSTAYSMPYSDELKSLAAEAICNPTDAGVGGRIADRMTTFAQERLSADAAVKGQTLDEYLVDPEAFKSFVESLATATNESALQNISPEDLILLSMDYGIRFQIFATTAFYDRVNIAATEKILQGPLFFKLMGMLGDPASCASNTNVVQTDRSAIPEKPQAAPTPVSGGTGRGGRR